jgi:hypothetical protein
MPLFGVRAARFLRIRRMSLFRRLKYQPEAQSATGVPPVSDKTEKTGGTLVPLFQPLDQNGLFVEHRRTLRPQCLGALFLLVQR